MRPLDAVLGLLAPPLCWSCGRGARPHDPFCRDCRTQLRWLPLGPVEIAGVELWAPLAYEGPARAVVRGLKFHGATALAAPMAAQIVACAPAGTLRLPARLVPVPLHPRRSRARGFNQAERLARAIAHRTGMRVDDCLARRGPPGARQLGRGREERLSGIAGAVRPRPGARLPTAAVLVDDVATTGATLAACAAALRAGGTERVVAVAYARTPGR